MVATLGGQPQVVTFALDALLGRGIVVRQVIVLSHEGEQGRTARALAKLQAEFTNNTYLGRPILLRSHPVLDDSRPEADLYDESDADAVWTAVNTLLGRLKADDHTLHICISGGRRMLGLLTLSAAMLHFGHQDRMWHLYSPRELREEAAGGAIMHAPPGADCRLVEVPLTPWGSIFPVFRDLTRAVRVDGAGHAERPVRDAMERARCAEVEARLTPRQREVARLLAEGLTPKQIAAHLNVTIGTVDDHKSVIYEECHAAWAIGEDVRLDYHFVREKFATYFAADRSHL
jgi:CRISPR-associated protein Csx14